MNDVKLLTYNNDDNKKRSMVMGMLLGQLQIVSTRLAMTISWSSLLGREPEWTIGSRMCGDVHFRQAVRHEGLEDLFLVPLVNVPWWMEGRSPINIEPDTSWDNWGEMRIN